MSYKIRFLCLKFSTLLVILLIFQNTLAQKKIKEIGINVFPEFDELLSHQQKALGNNVVAMIWTDTLVYKKELGDFTSTTQAPIASCSKWLTTALVMQFIDEGKLSLDDKVSKYIPLFASYNRNYITIRHCLSHMTGIRSEGSKLAKFVEQPKKYNSLEDEVNDLAKKEIQSNPGTEFSYSNLGIDVAARIVEIVSKKKFDLLIRSKLFVPLQMRQTSFSTLDGSAINPSSGAISTASDYMHFLQMLLNNGKYNGVQVLSEESVKQMRLVETTPEMIKYAPKIAQGYNYALGSWVMEDNNKLATVLTCPGLSGTWPVIDYCKGYACLIFIKSLLSEQKADIYNQMKAAVDEKLQSKCK
jgi:Beta-lactamase class C and other penicillin binding proteins